MAPTRSVIGHHGAQQAASIPRPHLSVGAQSWEQADAGIVNAHVAFWRHSGKKTYVQNLLTQQVDRVRAQIDQGAVIHVDAADDRYVLDVWAGT